MYWADNFKKIALLFILLFLSFVASNFVFGNILKDGLIFELIAIGLSLTLYLYRAVWIRSVFLVLGFCLLIYHLVLMNNSGPDFRVVQGFSMLEYLTVYITFIYGFVASRYLNGWAMLLNNLNHLRISKMHLTWTFLAFGLMLDIWWNSYSRGMFMERNVLNFILTLVVPLMFYFLSAFLFPLELLKGTYYDFRVFFEKHKKSFSVLMGLILLSNFVIANMAQYITLLTIENYIRLGGIMLALSAAVIDSKIFHQIVLISGCILLVIHSWLV